MDEAIERYSVLRQSFVRIMEELYIAQPNRLREGEVDIALGPLPENLTPGEFQVQSLMPIAMVIVVRKGNPLAKARRLADLAKTPWVYTGATADSGCAKILDERNGMRPPPTGAIVNSTLGLRSWRTAIVSACFHVRSQCIPLPRSPSIGSQWPRGR